MNNADDSFALMQALMEYRSQPISSELGALRKRSSMLHIDVLTLIYHFAKTGGGAVLEVGPYLGGSAVAAALGVRDSQNRRSIVTIEAGGHLDHPSLPSKNILKDLKKNLVQAGVADLITLLEGWSLDEKIVAAAHQRLQPATVMLLVLDADGAVQRDLDLYGDLLAPGCSLVFDDYYSPHAPTKAARTKPEVDALVAAGELETLGFYGWGTWVGRWRGRRA
jgi:predicted O-methyltransferase YrrM